MIPKSFPGKRVLTLARIALLVPLLIDLARPGARAAEPVKAPVTRKAADSAPAATQPHLVRVSRIWDAAPHCAFTDLVRFKDRWLCVFREGSRHVSPDGALRVIESKDGTKWTSAARISDAKADLRDAKIEITPEGDLLLAGAGALHDPEPVKHRSQVWRSPNGRDWTEAIDVGDPNFWLWRVSFAPDGSALGIGYQTKDGRAARLYRAKAGLRFETLVADLGIEGYPNESSILFVPESDAKNTTSGDANGEAAPAGTALCLLRRDPDHGLLGRARPPYNEWTWKDLGVRIGGPHWIRLPDGRFLAAVRLYDAPVRTSLAWIDVEKSTLTECLRLPSGGDTSYAGLVWHEKRLWVSYYSSHEEKTAIYFAEVELR